ncbi:hypothetical protein [Chitinophaga qingshengii]|uniref:Uncharacterized protein n=1 Tax=Chitinophaga qingshengii TaxID=1569794 RepID=A0ABR7TR89_9BACT|nr:hypothetical protein [Chitinophaga qingshengii]MBC9932006.1 hypothetical protein [Chitinophaga qingshengii]
MNYEKSTLFCRPLLHLLLCFVFGMISCQRDVIAPGAGLEQKQLTVSAVKNYYETRLRSSSTPGGRKEGTPLEQKQPQWDAAIFRKLKQGDDAVLTPLYLRDVYVKVGDNKMVKFGYLNYLMAYKSTNDSLVFEWVQLMPSEKWFNATSSRAFDGNILVRELNGTLKKSYSMADGKTVTGSHRSAIRDNNARIAPSISTHGLSTAREGDEQNPVDPDPVDKEYCWANVWVTKTTTAFTCPCEGHTFAEYSKCTCYKKPTPGSVTNTIVEVQYACEVDFDTPVGGGGTPGGQEHVPGGGLSSGGFMVASDYAPSYCNPDPNYTVPNTPPPAGLEYILPC